MTYVAILLLLLAAELAFFRIARKLQIVDKPNERSSHSKVVLRGGGVVFIVGVIIWSAFELFAGRTQTVLDSLPFLVGLLLVGGSSFTDDIHPLPDMVRFIVQLTATTLLLWSFGLLRWELWWAVPIGLFVCTGITNAFNFMDGINGITGGYSLAVLIPLLLCPETEAHHSLITTTILASLVFCFFNFRPKNQAKCFAGDVGAVGIAYILLFVMGHFILSTGDATYVVFLSVYGSDVCLTMLHRMLLHERLGKAHRKHAYQLMANELGMSHITVSTLYMVLQLAISLVFIYLIPPTPLVRWCYFLGTLVVFTIIYSLFMKKYYHLHEEYLASLPKQDD